LDAFHHVFLLGDLGAKIDLRGLSADASVDTSASQELEQGAVAAAAAAAEKKITGDGKEGCSSSSSEVVRGDSSDDPAAWSKDSLAAVAPAGTDLEGSVADSGHQTSSSSGRRQQQRQQDQHH